MKGKLIGFIFMLLIAGALLFAGCASTQTGSMPAGNVAITSTPGSSPESILVFAGAGLKAPLDEIGPLFTRNPALPYSIIMAVQEHSSPR